MVAADFVVVDTDIVSYLFGERPDAARFKPLLLGVTAAISFVTHAELLKGAYSANWSEARIGALRRYLRETYVVLPYDLQVAEHWGALVAACTKRGYVPGANDAWIAASFIAFDCTLVANDAGFKTNGHALPGA